MPRGGRRKVTPEFRAEVVALCQSEATPRCPAARRAGLRGLISGGCAAGSAKLSADRRSLRRSQAEVARRRARAARAGTRGSAPFRLDPSRPSRTRTRLARC